MLLQKLFYWDQFHVRYSPPIRIIWLIIAICAGVFITQVIPIEIESLLPGNINGFIRWILWIFIGALIGIALFVISIFMVFLPPIKNDRKAQSFRRVFLVSFSITASIWLIFLFAFWPGFMTGDSIDQWWQFTTGKYRNLAPLFHTLSVWAITRLWHSPAAVAIIQILVLSSVFAAGLAWLHRAFNFPVLGIVTVASLFALSPVNAVSINTLWKDIPYSICIFGLSILMLYIVTNDGIWFKKKVSGLILGLVCAGVVLFRHNGLPVALGSLVLIGVVYRTAWRQLLIAGCLALTLWYACQRPLQQLLGMNAGMNPINQIYIHQIAAHLNAGTPFSEDELQRLAAVHPAPQDWDYNCYTHAPTTNPFDWNLLLESNPDLPQIFWTTLKRNPSVNLSHIVCSSSIVWRITKPKKVQMVTYMIFVQGKKISSIPINELGLRSRPILPRLQTWLYENYLTPTHTPFYWRPAFYLYLGIFLTVILSLRLRSWRFVLFLAPVFLQSVTMCIINISQEVRYQYAAYLLALFALSFIFISARRGPPTEEQAKFTCEP